MNAAAPVMNLLQAVDSAITMPKKALEEFSNVSDSTKERVKSLQVLHKQRAAMQMEFQKELYALEFKYSKLYATSYQQQRNIVYERSLTEEEEENTKVVKGVGDGNSKITSGCPKSLNIAGIPNYWLTVFRNCPITSSLLTENDAAVLEYLVDIKCSFSKKLSSPGFRLLFIFRNNPYLKSNILVKQFSQAFYNTAEDLNESGPLKLISSKTSEIEWRLPKFPKNGNPNSSQSFFDLFRSSNPTSPDSMEYETLVEDYELCLYIKDRILPYSVFWFTGEIFAAQVRLLHQHKCFICFLSILL
uniref:Nucleosome assembly protein 1 n=1 Tax=Schistocephalus solidus TaxID=70667 RepID=A0A0X3PZU2_SCHSO